MGHGRDSLMSWTALRLGAGPVYEEVGCLLHSAAQAGSSCSQTAYGQTISGAAALLMFSVPQIGSLVLLEEQVFPLTLSQFLCKAALSNR